MSVPRILEVLQDPHRHHAALSLALTWPSLAAALSDLCDEHEVPAPPPLRVAARAVRTEGFAGDTAVAVLAALDKNWQE